MSGEYVRLYRGLYDDREYLAMSAEARLVFHVLKGVLGRVGIGVVYPEQLRAQTGLSQKRVNGAVKALMLAGGDAWWVRHEANVYWIRKGLAHENINRKNEITVCRMKVADLPNCALVDEFRAYYADHRVFSDVDNPEKPPRARGPTRGGTRAIAHAGPRTRDRKQSKAKQSSLGHIDPSSTSPVRVRDGEPAPISKILAEQGIRLPGQPVAEPSPSEPVNMRDELRRRVEDERQRKGIAE